MKKDLLKIIFRDLLNNIEHDKELFYAGAISAIYSHSSGIMRIVNKLCVHSLFQAISDGTTSLITEQTIEKVVKNPLNQNLAFC